jgi:hypothetical protein
LLIKRKEVVTMLFEAEVERALCHSDKVHCVTMKEGDLNDLQISHLKVENCIELIIVHALDTVITEGEGWVH